MTRQVSRKASSSREKEGPVLTMIQESLSGGRLAADGPAMIVKTRSAQAIELLHEAGERRGAGRARAEPPPALAQHLDGRGL
jgi:hypothetical protein